MIVFGFLVLKGRNILAQGKRRRSVALGKNEQKEAVRAKKFFKAKTIFRTPASRSYRVYTSFSK